MEGLAARRTVVGVAGIPAGHLPFAERPEQWLKIIVDFLDRPAAAR
ncbi:hypothetical protein [Actinomadura violacea]|uniref:Alpha/beta hydrolase n=1 Tax=Actinomadura violacea TaxID=2819934 RepID=A0ABS3RLF1_9ACTN|nr:hypothetical protein [Actinomadura violacea]MBO2457178.1 hypothetical protein [Actinomadura violacea]